MFGDVRVVDRLVASIASLPGLGRRMPMKRHDDSQRSGSPLEYREKLEEVA